MTLLLPLLAFIVASTIVATLGLVLTGNRGSVIERRLAEVTGDRPIGDERPRRAPFADLVKRIGSRIPVSPSEVGKVRQRLIQAGYRSPEAFAAFVGIRIVVALVAFVCLATPLFFKPNVAVGLGGSLLGYVLPGIVLARRARRRQHLI